MKSLRGLIFFAVILVLSSSSQAASMTGAFVAIDECPAYQSMRKKTNADNTYTAVDETYPIIEVKEGDDGMWYRVVTRSEQQPHERWVSAQCGHAMMASADPYDRVSDPSVETKAGKEASGVADVSSSASANKNGCSVTGKADSYVLALSWQPAFCEGHSKKPECGIADTNAYQAKHFTLHGLWPNLSSCGTHYGFCGEYSSKKMGDFCQYKSLSMKAKTKEELTQKMPGVASCLERWEWYKHGTCQSQWDVDGYFGLATRLLAEFNESGIAPFLAQNLGNYVKTEELLKMVDHLFGKEARKHLQIDCDKDDQLTEIRLLLPANLSQEASLATLLVQPAPEGYFRNRCGNSFFVDPIGLDNLPH